MQALACHLSICIRLNILRKPTAHKQKTKAHLTGPTSSSQFPTNQTSPQTQIRKQNKTKQKQSKTKQMHKRIQTTRSDEQNKRSPESVCFTGNFGSSAFFTDGGSDRGTVAAAPAFEATWAARVETSSSSSSPKRANGLMIDISIAGKSGDETKTLEP